MGCSDDTSTGDTTSTLDRTVMYRLSVRGRRGSRAAKQHAANKRFATEDAALSNLAHAGDVARAVPLSCSEDAWDRLFGSGLNTADLRSLADASGIP